MGKRKHSKRDRENWIEARVQNYIATRSPESLARMLVGLEGDTGQVPEFDIDEIWPFSVHAMKNR